MNKLFLGKINLSKIDKTKLFEGTTGKWMDLTVWFNEQPDQYGNNLSIEQSTKKGESKIYIGNAKFYIPKEDKSKSNKEGEWQGSASKEAIVNKSKEAAKNTDDLPFILTIPIALSLLMQFI
jgi:hypothetical protein